jgi:pimeloyl-ACP methyl ester carboxylesterase
MERVTVADATLEYALRGHGDPVVLIHWGVSGGWAEPLVQEPTLAEQCLLLVYHRAGFAGSSRVEGPLSIVDHARHCRLLLEELGIERAHVVGHSSSAVIALQVALDFPEVVQTLAVMEPARPVPATALQATFVRDHVAPAVQRYRAGDGAGAVDTFFRGVFGAGYRSRLGERAAPFLREAVAAVDAFFAQELPALQQWSFTEGDARRVTQPVLVVSGEHTSESFPERCDLLLSWLPNAEPYELRDASHLLHFENAAGLAEALAAFFARHPVAG